MHLHGSRQFALTLPAFELSENSAHTKHGFSSWCCGVDALLVKIKIDLERMKLV
jgi:hypothetical protein